MLCLDLILSDRVARAAGVQRSSAMRHQPFRKQSQMQELVRWDGLRKTPIPDSSCWLVLLSSLGEVGGEEPNYSQHAGFTVLLESFAKCFIGIETK